MSKGATTKQKVEEKPRITENREAYITREQWVPAFVEFLNLRGAGEIPADSRFVVGTMRAEVDGKTSNDVPVQVAVLPNGKFKILESGTNVNLIKSQQGPDGKAIIGLTRQIQEISMDEDGQVHMQSLQIQASPDEAGRIAEVRTEKRKGKPLEAVLQLTRDGFVILDWEEFIDSIDVVPIQFGARGVVRYTLKDVVESEPFQKYLGKLANHEFPEGTAFLFHLMNVAKDNGKVRTVMAAPAALFPNGGVKRLAIEITTEHGEKLMVTEGAIKITVLNAQKCPECGKVFTPSRPNQKYCSRRCGNRAKVKAFRKRQKENL